MKDVYNSKTTVDVLWHNQKELKRLRKIEKQARRIAEQLGQLEHATHMANKFSGSGATHFISHAKVRDFLKALGDGE